MCYFSEYKLQRDLVSFVKQNKLYIVTLCLILCQNIMRETVQMKCKATVASNFICLLKSQEVNQIKQRLLINLTILFV